MRPINSLPILEFTNDFASLLPSHYSRVHSVACAQRLLDLRRVPGKLALFRSADQEITPNYNRLRKASERKKKSDFYVLVLNFALGKWNIEGRVY